MNLYARWIHTCTHTHRPHTRAHKHIGNTHSHTHIWLHATHIHIHASTHLNTSKYIHTCAKKYSYIEFTLCMHTFIYCTKHRAHTYAHHTHIHTHWPHTHTHTHIGFTLRYAHTNTHKHTHEARHPHAWSAPELGSLAQTDGWWRRLRMLATCTQERITVCVRACVCMCVCVHFLIFNE